jgi:hypothetical protein
MGIAMLHRMKTLAAVLGSLSLIAAPSASSAGFFHWMHYGWNDCCYAPPVMQTAYYGGWDAGCCAPCNPCGSFGCSPCGFGGCGPGGCGPGGCQWNAPAVAPGGTPAPIPDGNMTRPETDAPPARSPRRTYGDEADPQNGGFVPPDTGTDRTTPPSRTTPRDRFTPRGSSGSGSNPDGSASGFDSNKPILGEEIVIPQKQPADIGPIREDDPARDAGALDGKTTSRPVVELQRMAVHTTASGVRIVRTPGRPAREWSAGPTDARVARH